MAIPQYQGGSIVNLMASIEAARGGRAPHLYPQLHALDSRRLAQARCLALLVIDGLGYDYLCEHGEGNALHAHLRAPVTSVFPATTAAAVTTFFTATAPQQHAHTGWFTYFEELGQVVAALPGVERGSGAELTPQALAQVLPVEPLFPRLRGASYVVSPETIAFSAFNTRFSRGARVVPYASLREMFDLIAAIARSEERSYVYAYWPDFDRLAHAFGVESRDVRRHLRELDKAFSAFLSQTAGEDLVVLVTADHGFVDSSPDQCVLLEQHPGLAALLAQPLCGEPRAAYCYVTDSAREEFRRLAEAELGAVAEVAVSAELIERGYFGLGPAHPRLGRRVGDFTLLARGSYNIRDRVGGERGYVQIGVHGGISEAEMSVPLIVAGAD